MARTMVGSRSLEIGLLKLKHLITMGTLCLVEKKQVMDLTTSILSSDEYRFIMFRHNIAERDTSYFC